MMVEAGRTVCSSRLRRRRALSTMARASRCVSPLDQCPSAECMTNHTRIRFGSQWKKGIMACGSIGNQKFGV